MMKREGRHTSRIAVLALLFSCALSSCQNSLLEGYQPSDDLQTDWESIRAFNRWIDPRVGAFLLMEESYIDENKFELEEEGTNVEGEVVGRVYRSKPFPDLAICAMPLNSFTLDLFDFKCPGWYVQRIAWKNSALSFLGWRKSEGLQAFGRACAEHLDELPAGPGLEPRWLHATWSDTLASVNYRCVPAECKPNPWWTPLMNPTPLFTLRASVGSLLYPDGVYLSADLIIPAGPAQADLSRVAFQDPRDCFPPESQATEERLEL